MAVEIERKFLVRNEDWRDAVTESHEIRQFYLARTGHAVVRVRIRGERRARLTVKGAGTGIERAEYEWDIPLDDARALAALAEGREIRKRRHLLPAGSLIWEIDVFEDGLVLAEIELPEAGCAFDRPGWLGEEVTGDPAYFNATMALGAKTERQ